MKFKVEVDSNFDIDIDSFIEIMNEVLSDSDFIMGVSSDKSYNDDRVVQMTKTDTEEREKEND